MTGPAIDFLRLAAEPVRVDASTRRASVALKPIAQGPDGGKKPRQFFAAERRYVDLADPASEADATAWWHAITAAENEGMAIKPVEGVVFGKKGMLQPASRYRGREYLQINYGPTFTEPQNLERLRNRAVAPKRIGRPPG